jgi:hypothetical protein
MELNFTCSGRNITAKDVEHIKEVIAQNPGRSRHYLSHELCRQWNWRQQNGVLRAMVCRGLLLKLHRGGLITLPPKKSNPPNPFLNRKPPALVEVDSTPIEAEIKHIKQDIELCQVKKTKSEKLYNSLINEHHYLKYVYPIGENLKYIAMLNERPIACIGWTSPPWYIGKRDRFIGWSAEVRKKNLHLMAYQTRFLILPWVKVPHLASFLLGFNARIISSSWEKVYNHPVYYLETFVDKERFKGTCYKAAGWIYLGDTTGRGKLAPTNKKTKSIKAVMGYPLCRDFREKLCRC